MADGIEDNPAAIDQALRSVEAKINRLADVVAETGNATLVNKLKELEAERTRLADDRAQVASKAKIKAGLRAITTKQVEAMLEFAPVPAEGVDPDVPYVRRTLGALVRRIELDPDARTTRVQYTVGLGGAKLASPRGFEPQLPP